MPTYEYECTKCSHSFEVFQAMSDEPLKKCPKCGKQIRRLIFGGAGVIFKGSGFYVTDKASGKSGGKNTTPAGASSDKPAADTARAASTPPAACESSAASPSGSGSAEKSDTSKGRKNSAAKSA
jgi:putative FmdB family regulatory protein